MESRHFLLRGGNVGIELCRLPLERPVPPPDPSAGGQQDQRAAERELLPRLQRADRFLLRRLPLDGEQIDFDHRSPALRSARPTATAAVGTRCSSCATPSFGASNAIFLNGSSISTGALKRSASAWAKSSTAHAPPLCRIRSMRSDAAVAFKKSKVFWISSRTFSVIAWRTGRTSSNAMPSDWPFLACSARSNGRPSSFCTASV